MTYDFTLDKKALVSVLAGWIIMAVLLFAAGLIVGTYWTTGGSSASAATSGSTVTNPGSAQAALPKEPVLRAEAPQLDLAAPSTAAGNLKTGAVPGQVTAVTQPVANAMDQVLNKKEAAAPPFDAAESKTQAAASEAAPASATGDRATDSSGAFTVQVGVFLEHNEASRLLKEMERKGYAPSFFADRDAEDRQWYTVRIGAYSDKDQAANAAANFTKQEKIKAVVRPLGSL